MDKKYELTDDVRVWNNHGFYFRIRALKDFGDVKKGDYGGYVEHEHNLSQEGNCWIYGIAVASENSYVRDNAKLKNGAYIKGNAIVGGNAVIEDTARICGNTMVIENANIRDDAFVTGDAMVKGHALIEGAAHITGNVWIYDNANVTNAYITDNAHICGDTKIVNDCYIGGNGRIMSNKDYFYIDGIGSQNQSITLYRNKNNQIEVSDGGFYGTINKYETLVKEIHKNTKPIKQYLALIEFARIYLKG